MESTESDDQPQSTRLLLEERHTLSIAAAKKKRELIPASLFLPLQAARQRDLLEQSQDENIMEKRRKSVCKILKRQENRHMTRRLTDSKSSELQIIEEIRKFNLSHNVNELGKDGAPLKGDGKQDINENNLDHGELAEQEPPNNNEDTDDHKRDINDNNFNSGELAKQKPSDNMDVTSFDDHKQHVNANILDPDIITIKEEDEQSEFIDITSSDEEEFEENLEIMFEAYAKNMQLESESEHEGVHPENELYAMEDWLATQTDNAIDHSNSLEKESPMDDDNLNQNGSLNAPNIAPQVESIANVFDSSIEIEVIGNSNINDDYEVLNRPIPTQIAYDDITSDVLDQNQSIKTEPMDPCDITDAENDFYDNASTINGSLERLNLSAQIDAIVNSLEENESIKSEPIDNYEIIDNKAGAQKDLAAITSLDAPNNLTEIESIANVSIKTEPMDICEINENVNISINKDQYPDDILSSLNVTNQINSEANETESFKNSNNAGPYKKPLSLENICDDTDSTRNKTLNSLHALTQIKNIIYGWDMNNLNTINVSDNGTATQNNSNTVTQTSSQDLNIESVFNKHELTKMNSKDNSRTRNRISSTELSKLLSNVSNDVTITTNRNINPMNICTSEPTAKKSDKTLSRKQVPTSIEFFATENGSKPSSEVISVETKTFNRTVQNEPLSATPNIVNRSNFPQTLIQNYLSNTPNIFNYFTSQAATMVMSSPIDNATSVRTNPSTQMEPMQISNMDNTFNEAPSTKTKPKQTPNKSKTNQNVNSRKKKSPSAKTGDKQMPLNLRVIKRGRRPNQKHAQNVANKMPNKNGPIVMPNILNNSTIQGPIDMNLLQRGPHNLNRSASAERQSLLNLASSAQTGSIHMPVSSTERGTMPSNPAANHQIAVSGEPTFTVPIANSQHLDNEQQTKLLNQLLTQNMPKRRASELPRTTNYFDNNQTVPTSQHNQCQTQNQTNTENTHHHCAPGSNNVNAVSNNSERHENQLQPSINPSQYEQNTIVPTQPMVNSSIQNVNGTQPAMPAIQSNQHTSQHQLNSANTHQTKRRASEHPRATNYLDNSLAVPIHNQPMVNSSIQNVNGTQPATPATQSNQHQLNTANANQRKRRASVHPRATNHLGTGPTGPTHHQAMMNSYIQDVSGETRPGTTAPQSNQHHSLQQSLTENIHLHCPQGYCNAYAARNNGEGHENQNNLHINPSHQVQNANLNSNFTHPLDRTPMTVKRRRPNELPRATNNLGNGLTVPTHHQAMMNSYIQDVSGETRPGTTAPQSNQHHSLQQFNTENIHLHCSQGFCNAPRNNAEGHENQNNLHINPFHQGQNANLNSNFTRPLDRTPMMMSRRRASELPRATNNLGNGLTDPTHHQAIMNSYIQDVSGEMRPGTTAPQSNQHHSLQQFNTGNIHLHCPPGYCNPYAARKNGEGHENQNNLPINPSHLNSNFTRPLDRPPMTVRRHRASELPRATNNLGNGPTGPTHHQAMVDSYIHNVNGTRAAMPATQSNQQVNTATTHLNCVPGSNNVYAARNHDERHENRNILPINLSQSGQNSTAPTRPSKNIHQSMVNSFIQNVDETRPATPAPQSTQRQYLQQPNTAIVNPNIQNVNDTRRAMSAAQINHRQFQQSYLNQGNATTANSLRWPSGSNNVHVGINNGQEQLENRNNQTVNTSEQEQNMTASTHLSENIHQPMMNSNIDNVNGTRPAMPAPQVNQQQLQLQQHLNNGEAMHRLQRIVWNPDSHYIAAHTHPSYMQEGNAIQSATPAPQSNQIQQQTSAANSQVQYHLGSNNVFVAINNGEGYQNQNTQSEHCQNNYFLQNRPVNHMAAVTLQQHNLMQQMGGPNEPLLHYGNPPPLVPITNSNQQLPQRTLNNQQPALQLLQHYVPTSVIPQGTNPCPPNIQLQQQQGQQNPNQDSVYLNNVTIPREQ